MVLLKYQLVIRQLPFEGLSYCIYKKCASILTPKGLLMSNKIHEIVHSHVQHMVDAQQF